MVDPLDPRGLKPLPGVRPATPKGRGSDGRKPAQQSEKEDGPATGQAGSDGDRRGRHIDEEC